MKLNGVKIFNILSTVSFKINFEKISIDNLYTANNEDMEYFKDSFEKVLFNEDMIKSNRSFSITKLKNNIKIIDSFIYSEEKNLVILTSIGRIFKFDLSNKLLTPTSKQSQGLMLAKLLVFRPVHRRLKY